MPFVNLIVAQAAAGWLAPEALAPLLMRIAPELAPYAPYVVAIITATVIIIGGYLGAKIAGRLPIPTLTMIVTTIAAALIGTLISVTAIAPEAGKSEALYHLTTFFPVICAIGGYFLSAPRGEKVSAST